MSSKRKPNGSTSVREVEGAMKKLSCSTSQLFEQAVKAAGANKPDHFDAHLEARRFADFQRGGAVAYPNYRIPGLVLNFVAAVNTVSGMPKLQTIQKVMMRPAPMYT